MNDFAGSLAGWPLPLAREVKRPEIRGCLVRVLVGSGTGLGLGCREELVHDFGAGGDDGS